MSRKASAPAVRTDARSVAYIVSTTILMAGHCRLIIWIVARPFSLRLRSEHRVHLQIHQHDIRVERPHLLYRLLAILRLADDLKGKEVGVMWQGSVWLGVLQRIAVSRAFRLRRALG